MSKNSPQQLDPATLEARRYFESGDYENAVKAYNEIFSNDPTNIEAGERIGFMMINKGHYETAERIFLYLLKIYPDNSGFNSSLGNIYSVLGKFEEAVKYGKKAADLEPRNINYHLNMGAIYYLKGDADDSIKCYKYVAEVAPDNVQAIQALCDLTNLHSPTEAEQYMQKLCRMAPTDVMIIGTETFVPVIYRSQEEIDSFRTEFLKKIDNLLARDLKIQDLTKKTYLSIFYLAYHAKNNRELKLKMAELYSKVAPELEATASHCVNYKFNKDKKIKVGFISAFFHKHPVAICFNGEIIEFTTDPRLDVHLIHIGHLARQSSNAGGDDYLNNLKKHVHPENYYLGDEDFYKIREDIAKKEFDIIIYPEIGMYWLVYFLGFARLAPVQAVLTGHPDTTGLKNIDYYISCDDFEAEGAEEYYSEKLIRLKNIPTCIQKPDWPEKFKIRKELDLPEDKNIYYCPMKNHKFHPDFDDAIKGILEKDPNAVIMFPKDTGITSEIATKRIKKNIGKKLLDRLIYHPWASNVEFLSYLKEVDVVLDTFHFGAGTTLYYAFAVNAPVVTLPGMTSGGRVTNAVYKKMGITDLIAKDKNDYIELAVKCGTNKEFRESIRNKINSKKEILYNDISAVPEIKNFLISELKKFS